jgi:sugar phosphate isomerase/epimerase
MKLCLDTYSIGSDFTLAELIALLQACRLDGVEFRCEANQRHGVELEAPPQERRRIKALLDEAGLQVASLSTSQRFESPDPTARQKVIERVKRYIDLAADLGATGVRTFGNDFPAGVPRLDVVRYVGESLRICGEHAQGSGVNVLLEMHGEFYYWEYALGAVQIADHPQVAINFNCDPRDLVDDSVATTFQAVQAHVRHVHLHELEDGVFPYVELFGLLKRLGYAGWLSLEEGYHEGGEKKVIALYAALLRALLGQA